MSQEIKVHAEPRSTSGSTAARRLRRAGSIPAVLSKLGGETALLQLNAHDFERTVSQHVSAQLLVTLDADGKSCMALLREIQRNGITGRITHADFSQVDTRRKMRVQIQIVLIGDPEGVRTQNGVLEQHLRHVEVACLPADIVESFTVDVSALKVGDDITVADLQLGDKFALHTRPETVIATVAEVKEEVVAAPDATAADAAAAQPELSVKKGKAEEEGAAAAPAAAAPAKDKAKAK